MQGPGQVEQLHGQVGDVGVVVVVGRERVVESAHLTVLEVLGRRCDPGASRVQQDALAQAPVTHLESLDVEVAQDLHEDDRGDVQVVRAARLHPLDVLAVVLVEVAQVVAELLEAVDGQRG